PGRAGSHGVVRRVRGPGRALLGPRAPPGTRSRPRRCHSRRRRGLARRATFTAPIRLRRLDRLGSRDGPETHRRASSVPSLPPFHVARPRRLDLLDDGAELPLTAVVAPPGAGKSVVLASWVHERCPAAAWVACEERHSDPV